MTSKTLSDVVRPVVIEHLGDAPGAALPHVIETLNSYLEAATDAICNGGVLDALLGDLVSARCCSPACGNDARGQTCKRLKPRARLWRPLACFRGNA